MEAQTNALTSLGTAVKRAVSMGAVAVSNSYLAGEFQSEESTYGSYYNNPGVAITASSGDSGYGVGYPAASPNVISVGGTSLTRSGNGFVESAWSGSGSGCSAVVAKPQWQTDSGCSRRTVADVAAVADPNTGVWVYNTFGSVKGFQIFGGTSASSPIVAALYALGTSPVPNPTGAYLYSHTSALNDVTTGSNGTCSVPYLCHAGPGYDGPTGLGTPNGAAAFGGVSSAPDFSVGATSTSLSVNPGATAHDTINLTPTGSFSGSVDVSVAVDQPSGLSATPAFSTLPLSAPNSIDLTLSALAPGTYDVTVTATQSGGVLSHSMHLSVTVPVPDFSLASSPSSITLNSGSGTTTTLALGSIGGFVGNVDLQVAVTGTGEVSASSSADTVALSGAGGSATLSIASTSAASGPYTITVTATAQGGGPTHQASVVVTAVQGDFALAVPSPTVLVSRGNTAKFVVNVSATGGFAGPVTFTLSGQIPSDIVTFTPSTVNGAGSTTLSIQPSKQNTTGPHQYKITGTSGARSRTATVTAYLF